MANAVQWQDLSKRQKKIFGSKKAFKVAKDALRKEGGDVSRVLTIKNWHRENTSTSEPTTETSTSKPTTETSTSKPTTETSTSKRTAKTSTNEPDVNALRAKVGLPPLSEEEAQKRRDKQAQDKAFGEHAESIGGDELQKRIKEAGGYNNYRELFDKGEHESESLKIQDTTEDETPNRFRDDVKELGADGVIDAEDVQELEELHGPEKVGERLVIVSDKKDIELSEDVSDSLKIEDTTEEEAPNRFRDDVKELGADGVIDAEDVQELEELHGPDKVEERLEIVSDKKDIELSEEVSDSLKIEDTTEDVEEPQTEDETPNRFRDDVNELGQDGIIDEEDEQELIETWGEEKVDDKLEKIVDKKDYEFSEELSESLNIQDTTEDTESTQSEDETPNRFRDDVNELGQDGIIDSEDEQKLIETWGEEKVDDKLEKIVDKKDYEFSEELSESLGIADNSGESENRFRDDVKEFGADGYIDSDEEQQLIDTWGEEKVDDKLETITDKKDIEIGENIYEDGGLNINEPEQAEEAADVEKTGQKAFQRKLDKYYKEGLEKYEGRMQKFAKDYNSEKGIKRYKGKKDESGRNKIQREYKDKRSEDAKAYDKDKSQFQKDKLNSLYAQRRDLLDDKGMVKRPSLDVSTTPNPYEGAISEIKQSLGIQKPNSNYLKDQVKSSLTLKINKPSLDLNIKGAESNAPKFKTKQFTRLDRNYKPRT